VTHGAAQATTRAGDRADSREGQGPVISRRMLRRVLASILVVASVAGCSSSEIARNVYEGGRAYDESIRGTPLEKSHTPAPGFDEYDRARRAPSAQGRGD